jgi:hypothetical protein
MDRLRNTVLHISIRLRCGDLLRQGYGSGPRRPDPNRTKKALIRNTGILEVKVIINTDTSDLIITKTHSS